MKDYAKLSNRALCAHLYGIVGRLKDAGLTAAAPVVKGVLMENKGLEDAAADWITKTAARVGDTELSALTLEIRKRLYATKRCRMAQEGRAAERMVFDANYHSDKRFRTAMKRKGVQQ